MQIVKSLIILLCSLLELLCYGLPPYHVYQHHSSEKARLAYFKAGKVHHVMLFHMYLHYENLSINELTM